ncbi:hypothetical protein B0H17DRAFT_1033288 [Mycena rosella]|uniref:Secreted protein n=1 Tax=Mycena rosella TaxID=1033263 RepID=A0AAD7GY28_MYCRO|nr:hypothetical protein B0H17DRAFT_1033288 [Mycena rosella]
MCVILFASSLLPPYVFPALPSCPYRPHLIQSLSSLYNETDLYPGVFFLIITRTRVTPHSLPPPPFAVASFDSTEMSTQFGDERNQNRAPHEVTL